MHPNSELMFSRHALPYFEGVSRVLEVGPDLTPSTYQRLVANTSITWEYAELDPALDPDWVWGHARELTHLMTDPCRVPVPDGSFDLVVSGQVIEHVRRPWRWMPEMARICRPGGLVVTVSPISWPHHDAPVDCWRIYPEGMRALSEDSGLEVLLCEEGTLEEPPSPNRYQGTSYVPGTVYTTPVPSGWSQRLKAEVKRRLHWPLPVSVDLVTVARRPLGPAKATP